MVADYYPVRGSQTKQCLKMITGWSLDTTDCQWRAESGGPGLSEALSTGEAGEECRPDTRSSVTSDKQLRILQWSVTEVSRRQLW